MDIKNEIGHSAWVSVEGSVGDSVLDSVCDSVNAQILEYNYDC